MPKRTALTRGTRGTPITFEQLTDAEKAYVKNLETIGLRPSGFVRFSDGSLAFGASRTISMPTAGQPGPVKSSHKSRAGL